MNTRIRSVAALAALSLGGCATIPSGPSTMVLPGNGKSFEEFQADNGTCRQFAQVQTGQNPNQIVAQSTLNSAAVGAVLGGVLGAVAGQGRGAAIGAASGALLGTAVGSDAGNASGYDAQRRYDMAYQQCMYAKGNQVPVVVQAPGYHYYPTPPAQYYYPPPPAGYVPSVPPPGTPPPAGYAPSVPPPGTPAPMGAPAG